MTAALAQKSKRYRDIAPEAQNLERLREAASSIARRLEAGEITEQDASRLLKELVSSNVTLSYRVFGI